MAWEQLPPLPPRVHHAMPESKSRGRDRMSSRPLPTSVVHIDALWRASHLTSARARQKRSRRPPYLMSSRALSATSGSQRGSKRQHQRCGQGHCACARPIRCCCPSRPPRRRGATSVEQWSSSCLCPSAVDEQIACSTRRERRAPRGLPRCGARCHEVKWRPPKTPTPPHPSARGATGE